MGLSYSTASILPFSVLMLVSTAVRRPPDHGNTVPSRVHTRPFLWLWRNSCFNTSIEHATWPIGPGLGSVDILKFHFVIPAFAGIQCSK